MRAVLRLRAAAVLAAVVVGASLAGCASDSTDSSARSTAPATAATDGAPGETADPGLVGPLPGPAGDYDTFGLDGGQVDPPTGFPAELALPAFDCQVGALYEQLGVGYWPGVDGRWRHDCLATVSQTAFDGGVDAAMAEIAAGLEAQGLTVSALAQCPYPAAQDPELAALADAFGPLTYVMVTGLADGGVAGVYAMSVNMGEPGYVGANTSAWSVSVYFRPDSAS